MNLGGPRLRRAVAARIRWWRERRAERAVRSQIEREAATAVDELRRLKESKENRRLCGILLVEHIGDIIACEPVIRRLRAEHPDAILVWITGSRYRDLVKNHPVLDAVVTVPSLAPIAAIIRSGVLDVAVDLHVNKKPTGVEGVIHEKQWGNPSVDCFNYFDQKSILRAFTAAAGIASFREPPTMYLDAATATRVDSLSLPDRCIVIHATSNEASRDWSSTGWNALLRYILEDCDLTVVEVGLKSVLEYEHPNLLSLCGELSILETAEVIRRSQFFIGVDSAPAHMANASRRPALLLFGEYRNTRTWCPYDGGYAEREREIILRHPGPLSELPATEVISRLQNDHAWRAILAMRQDAPSTR
jgi:heptosyltransferase-3